MGPPRTRRHRHWPGRLVVVVLVLAGVVVTSWPIGTTVVDNYQRTQSAIQVEQDTARATPTAVSRQLSRARHYNATLRPGALQDPWGAHGVAVTPDEASYLDQLSLFPAMCTLTIPLIRVRLPIYHNTTPQSMAHGVGHFFGSSLPIGGVGTHAVLAGHTGMSYATLFDRLPELRVGDRFWIRIYGEVLAYQVDQVTTVLPNQLDQIARVKGKDYVTLVTCTPRLVNTYRLLVRGVRVPEAAAPAEVTTSSVTQSTDLTIQHWMLPRLWISAGALGVLVLIVAGWIIGDRRRRTSRTG